MLVEDSLPLRQQLSMLISEAKAGLVVGEVGSVAGALFLLHSTLVDAVVLDLHLWDGDGCTVLSEVKRRQPACVVIVLSSMATPEKREHCLRLGADYFFDKTLDLQRVPEVLALMGATPPALGMPPASLECPPPATP